METIRISDHAEIQVRARKIARVGVGGRGGVEKLRNTAGLRK